MAQALYRRWRSQAFETVVGQEHITLTLRNALRDGRMSHAYLFTGPRGTGKTSTARILAKAINCLADDPNARPDGSCRICTAIGEGRLLDLIEIDAASNRGIDEIRDLREKINFRPNEARYKVYIIDEVHMLTKEAFNALLKTLEEPPLHAVFVLATTEPDRVPETVRSRCQRFDFRRIPTGEIVAHLAEIVASEGCQAEQEALTAVARRSTGSMRDAISLLDQLLSYGDETLTLARVEQVLGLINLQTIGRLVGHVIDGETGAGLTLLNALVAEGVELSQLVDQITAYLRGVLFVRVAQTTDAVDLPQDVLALMSRQANQLSVPALLAAMREFTEARAALKDQIPGVPQLPLELAFLRAAGAARGDIASSAGPASGGAIHTAPAATAAPSSAPASGSSRPVERVRATSTETYAVERQAAPTQPAAGTSGQAPAGETQPAADANKDLLAAVRENWQRVLSTAGRKYGVKLQAALRDVREMDVLNSTIVLYFLHPFQRNMVAEQENRQRIESTWHEVLGRPVTVRCALSGEQVGKAAGEALATRIPDSNDDDEVLLQEARRRGAKVTRLE